MLCRYSCTFNVAIGVLSGSLIMFCLVLSSGRPVLGNVTDLQKIRHDLSQFSCFFPGILTGVWRLFISVVHEVTDAHD